MIKIDKKEILKRDGSKEEFFPYKIEDAKKKHSKVKISLMIKVFLMQLWMK